MKKNIFLPLLALCLIISGCASLPNQLPKNTSNTLKKVDMFIDHPDMPLAYLSDDTSSYAAAGFGILGLAIGSAIDAGRNAKWKKNAVHVTDAVGQYNHIDTLEQDISEAFEGTDLVINFHRVTTDEISKNNLPDTLKLSGSDDVSGANIVFRYSYNITHGFNSLSSNGYASAYVVEEQVEEKQKATAGRFINPQVSLIKPSDKEVSVIVEDLTNDGGRILKTALAKLSKDNSYQIKSFVLGH